MRKSQKRSNRGLITLDKEQLYKRVEALWSEGRNQSIEKIRNEEGTIFNYNLNVRADWFEKGIAEGRKLQKAEDEEQRLIDIEKGRI